MGTLRSIRIGDWTVTPALNQLERDGHAMHIEPRAMEALVYLADRAGEVVSAHTLIAAIWGGRVVGDGSVYLTINHLRQALGDDKDDVHYIQTIPKRGYRLVAPVKALESEPSAAAAAAGQGKRQRLRFFLAGGAVLAVAIGVMAFSRLSLEREPSIAVLPFDNLSTETDDAYFVDGIHGELLSELFKIGSLKVISRTSVMQYRESPRNLTQIGEELGASSILEGSVQRAGDTVRIMVQLIDAAADQHLWGETYTRELTAENIFAVQNEIAVAIAAALNATLSPEEIMRLGEAPTQSTQAYNFYLTGKDYSRRVDFRTYLPLAIEMYEFALEEDPQFALALASLSITHGQMYWFGFDRTATRLGMAAAAALQALDLAPELPEAHLAMGYYHYRGFRDYGRALAEFLIAEEGLPGSAELHEARAYVLRRLGRWEESLDSMARAIEVNPRNANLFFQQAGTYNMLRDYAQAEEHLRRALQIAPDSVNAYVYMARLPLRQHGDVAPANAAADNPPLDIGIDRQRLGWTAAIYERNYDRAIDFLHDWDIDVFVEEYEYLPKSALYGLTYKLAGRPEQAEPELQAARLELEAALERNPGDPRLYISLAQVLAELDEHTQAVRMARRAMEMMPRSRDAYAAPDYQLLAAKVFAAMGDHEAAIEILDEYLAAPGDWSIEGLLPDPRLDSIRDDSRFQALVEKYGHR